LAAEALPVEQHRRARICAEISALSAFAIGEEGEAVRPVLFHQHHSDRWLSAFPCGGQCGGLGVTDFLSSRLREPAVEQREWVGGIGHAAPYPAARRTCNPTVQRKESSIGRKRAPCSCDVVSSKLIAPTPAWGI